MTEVRTTAVRAFIAAMSLAASLSLFYGFAHWHSSDTVKFGAYLLAALFASSLKVTLRCSVRAGAAAVERPEYGMTATIL